MTHNPPEFMFNINNHDCTLCRHTSYRTVFMLKFERLSCFDVSFFSIAKLCFARICDGRNVCFAIFSTDAEEIPLKIRA